MILAESPTPELAPPASADTAPVSAEAASLRVLREGDVQQRVMQQQVRVALVGDRPTRSPATGFVVFCFVLGACVFLARRFLSDAELPHA